MTITENSSAITYDTQGPRKYPEITVETHLHVRHGTETILVFVPADGEASWLLLPSSVSLLSGSRVQPENTYSCMLKVTNHV